MQVMQQPQLNNIRYYNSNIRSASTAQKAYQPQFTSATSAVNAKASSFVGQKYDKFTEWIANNYYKRFYNSKFAKSFIEHTKGKAWNNMTTHMSALGSTLISSMYVIKTLENDKLDPEKRKTLAINDVLTWGVSTAGAYFLDAKLGDWWEGVTTRFTANYLLDNKKAKRVSTLGDWNPKDLRFMMENWSDLVNARIDKINAKITSPEYKGGRKQLEKVPKQVYENIRDFNLDVLKNRKLTTMIDGMGVLKSLFVFGMVYRYVVPVLVMKPANKIGQYIHNKKAENNNAQEKTQKA